MRKRKFVDALEGAHSDVRPKQQVTNAVVGNNFNFSGNMSVHVKMGRAEVLQSKEIDSDRFVATCILKF